MMLRDARVNGDGVTCWHCPRRLGTLLDGWGGSHIINVQPYYEKAPGDPMPGVTVLRIPPRIVANLHYGRLGFERKQRLSSDGRMRLDLRNPHPLPVVMPCWGPSCREGNRVLDTAMTNG